MKFYPTDWRSDSKLRICGLAARGLWIEMLGVMHESDRYGHLVIGGRILDGASLSALIGAPTHEIVALLDELEQAGVFSRSRDGAIYSRKMVRDYKRSNVNRKNVKKRWNLDHPQDTESNDKKDSRNTTCNTRKKPEARNQNKYWWSGEIIKLTKTDYDSWFRRFKGSDDKFVDWLNSRDRWYQDQPVNVQKNWFIATSKALEKLEG